MKIRKILLVILLHIGLYTSVSAQDFYLPEPSGLVVTDFENLLTEGEISQLAGIIKPSYRSSSNQLIVVCVPTKFMGTLTIEDYANKLFKKWQPGQKGLNNGVLMIITGSKLDSVGRKLRFEVGYGLEGALPDLLCKKIQKQLMVPKLKEHKYFEAIKAGSQAILAAIANENIGKSVIFRSAVSNSPVLKDGVGLLDLQEFRELEKRLIALKGNEIVSGTIQAADQDAEAISYVYVTEPYKTDGLFDLQIGYPIEIAETDSTVTIVHNEKSRIVHYTARCSDDNRTAEEVSVFTKKLEQLMAEGKYKEMINSSLDFYEEGRRNKYAVFYTWMIVQFMLALLIVAVYFIARKKLKGKNLYRKGTAPNIVLAVFTILTGIIVFPSVCTADFVQMNLWNFWLDFSAGEMWAWGIGLLAVHVVSAIYILKAGGLRERSNYKSSYSSSSSYSNNSTDSNTSSSYSSSDYSSSSESSSSSSSSDSNTDYGGGGGDSGGGGSSSDW